MLTRKEDFVVSKMVGISALGFHAYGQSLSSTRVRHDVGTAPRYRKQLSARFHILGFVVGAQERASETKTGQSGPRTCNVLHNFTYMLKCEIFASKFTSLILPELLGVSTTWVFTSFGSINWDGFVCKLLDTRENAIDEPRTSPCLAQSL